MVMEGVCGLDPTQWDVEFLARLTLLKYRKQVPPSGNGSFWRIPLCSREEVVATKFPRRYLDGR
jgi:hypothetical protein